MGAGKYKEGQKVERTHLPLKDGRQIPTPAVKHPAHHATGQKEAYKRNIAPQFGRPNVSHEALHSAAATHSIRMHIRWYILRRYILRR
jgi:hypothetical protein